MINTKLGHIIAGGLPTQNEVTKVVSLICTKCDTNVNSIISKFWETEKVTEVLCDKNEHDLVESKFQSTVKLLNNKFQVDLLLKTPLDDVNETLGNSVDLDLYRFLNLAKIYKKI